MVYLITYELKPGRKHNTLYEQIKTLGVWSHYLETSWFVVTRLSVTEIQDKLLPHIDTNDFLFISEITSYSGWLPKDAWSWLSRYI